MLTRALILLMCY